MLVEILTGVNVKLGAAISPGVGDRMIGVAVTTPGVRDGMGVQTGNGWGATLRHHTGKQKDINNYGKYFLHASIIPLRFCD